MEAHDIIIRPLVTEKSTDLISAQNTYTFQVDIRANKSQVKDAIEKIFKVRVSKVNTMRVLGKVRRMGKTQGKRPDWKKAMVTLADGHSIKVFDGL